MTTAPILALATAVALSPGNSSSNVDRTQFQIGVAAGCYESMIEYGNSEENANAFCGCFSSVIVNSMSQGEYQKATSGDRSIVTDVLARSKDNLRRCEDMMVGGL